MQREVLKLITCFDIKQPILLYRGTRDGFAPEKFHQLCDGKGPTLTVAMSEYKRIFGGFTTIPWTAPKAQRRVGGNGNSFIFTFDR